ncbi:MAG TPA: hypothetical protein VFB16_09575 [Bauldia sp.]|nr:hypothetical protein [Bauldia sp.]
MGSLALQSIGADLAAGPGETGLFAADTATKPTLCFVHIPKTGGSAIRDTLRVLRGNQSVFWLDSRESFEAQRRMTHADFKSFDAVGGHVSVAAFRHLVVAPRIVASLVRDPVRRAISLLHYIQEGDWHHPLHAELRNLSVAQALEKSTAYRADVTNAQCWMLGLDGPSPETLPDTEDERWMLRSTDMADSLMASLCSAFGWQPVELPHLNRAHDPAYFERLATPEAVRLLTELNVRDLALLKAVERMSAPENLELPV